MEVTGRRIATLYQLWCERDEEGHRERMREVTRYFRNAVWYKQIRNASIKMGSFV